jgi:hypothetical protein
VTNRESNNLANLILKLFLFRDGTFDLTDVSRFPEIGDLKRLRSSVAKRFKRGGFAQNSETWSRHVCLAGKFKFLTLFPPLPPGGALESMPPVTVENPPATRLDSEAKLSRML